MKKLLSILLALALFACLLIVPASAEEPFQANILFCGSTSLYPILSSLASSFTEEYVKWNAVDASMPEKNILSTGIWIL